MLESLKHEDLQFQELTPEEKQSRGILARLTGPIASFTKGTRNGRKYSDKLWEKAFDAPLVKEMFKNGGLPGELQHPEGRSETDPTKIAIMMPEPPKKDSKGHLVASVDILDTPCGQIAYQLGKYGFKFGISSRGEGDLIQDFSGEESVDPDTYTLNAFDLVLIPACEDARLQFNESLETKPTNNLRTILSEALKNATDVDRKIMEEALDELNIDDNWRYVETYEDNDIFFEPGTKKYIVGDLDSYTALNSLKNAKEYIDRFNPDGQFFKESLLKEGGYEIEYYLSKPFEDGWDFTLSSHRSHENFDTIEELRQALKDNGLPASLAEFDRANFDKDNGYIRTDYQHWHAFAYPPATYDNWSEDGPIVNIVEGKLNEEVFHLEYIYDTYDDRTDRSDRNLRSYINVKANSEEEAIEKAKKYLANTHRLNVRQFQITDARYTNVDLVEEQVDREETKPATSASEILKNKPQPEKKVQEQPPEVNVNVQVPEKEEELEEGLSPQEKMDAWHHGERRENIKACGNAKLIKYLGICKDSGYMEEAQIIRNELKSRDIPVTEDVEDIHREDDEPEREKWDTDFHRLDVAYNHNFRQFEDMEADAGVIRDFTDDLDAQGKEYDIYKHTSDPGCTIFFEESLEEDMDEALNESCDGWIAFYNGKKLEISKSEADNLYSAKQKAIKELKVPKSKLGLLAIKPAYNESLTELDETKAVKPKKEFQLVAKEFNSTLSYGGEETDIQSAVVIIPNAFKDSNGETTDAIVHCEDLTGEEINFKTVEEAQDWIDSYGKDCLYRIDNNNNLCATPVEAYSKENAVNVSDYLGEALEWDDLNSTEQSAAEAALAEMKNGSTIEDAVHGAVTMYNEENTNSDYEDEDFYMEEADYQKVLDYVKGHNKMNEAKYTRDELFDKFGTDDLDIINAGNEEVVELAADDDGALVEQLQKILKHNKSLEEQVKKLQEKISVGYAKEIELKEELDSYKQKVTKLSEKTKEIKVLNEKLSKAENKLEESVKTAKDNASTLNESIKSKDLDNKKLEKNIANLNEAIDKKNIKIRSLNEEINKYKTEIDSKNADIEQLKEQYETGQKDLEQLKNQYSKKLEKQNQIIEKYQRVAKNSVKRYIESQAVRLGVKSDEIVNRLPKNYSFNDIDTICEDLQEYKFNMNNLPFGQYGLNENVKVTAKNISKAPVENPADEITDYDLKIAEAFL